MKLRTLLVEDEPLSQYYLNSLLLRLSNVDIVGTAATEDEAVAAITSLKPELVFLDIELHSGTGFDVLRKTRHHQLSVVFTTALEQQAIRMIKLSGVPFLQKPIDADELSATVDEVSTGAGKGQTAQQHLLQTLDNGNVPQRMLVREGNTSQYIELERIVHIASGDRTFIHLREGNTHTDGRSLKELESLLEDLRFFRCAATHLVNLKCVRSVSPDGQSLVLADGTSVPLSPKKREALLDELARI